MEAKKVKKKQSIKKQAAITLILQAAEKWPSPFVARKEVSNFTGGIYSQAHLRNMDSLRKGPEGAFRIGRSVAYPVDALCDWLISKLEV